MQSEPNGLRGRTVRSISASQDVGATKQSITPRNVSAAGAGLLGAGLLGAGLLGAGVRCAWASLGVLALTACSAADVTYDVAADTSGSNPVGEAVDTQFGSQQQALTNADPVEQCGFPTTVNVGGCTGTLVHEKVISAARHCNPDGGSITFGEGQPSFHRVSIVRCIGQGSQDAMLCELEEAVPLPVTPVLFGCEVDKYMQPGQEVLFAGFGRIAPDGPAGRKRWAPQVIDRVEARRTIIGKPGDPVSPCPGDSGGPVFVMAADGSLRVFGTVLGGTTGIQCNSAVNMQRIDTVLPHFERITGIDITPCFDGQTGDWDPGPDCGGFNQTLESGQGDWENWCEGSPASGMSAECGEPYGADPMPPAPAMPEPMVPEPLPEPMMPEPMMPEPMMPEPMPEPMMPEPMPEPMMPEPMMPEPMMPEPMVSEPMATGPEPAEPTPPVAPAPAMSEPGGMPAAGGSPIAEGPAAANTGATEPNLQPPATEEGCGCSVAGRRNPRTPIWFVAPLLVAFAAMRRRQHWPRARRLATAVKDS